MKLIERGVVQKESRYIIRALRSIQKLRKQLNDNVLWNLLSSLPTGMMSTFLVNDVCCIFLANKQVLSYVNEVNCSSVLSILVSIIMYSQWKRQLFHNIALALARTFYQKLSHSCIS